MITFHSRKTDGLIRVEEQEVNVWEDIRQKVWALVNYIGSPCSFQNKLTINHAQTEYILNLYEPILKKKSFPHSNACFAKYMTQSDDTNPGKNYNILLMMKINFIFLF